MPAILKFYFWFRFRPYHRSRHVILLSLLNFIQIGPPSAEKMTSCRFSRCRISAILDFRGPIMGSLKSPCTTSCRSETCAETWHVKHLRVSVNRLRRASVTLLENCLSRKAGGCGTKIQTSSRQHWELIQCKGKARQDINTLSYLLTYLLTYLQQLQEHDNVRYAMNYSDETWHVKHKPDSVNRLCSKN